MLRFRISSQVQVCGTSVDAATTKVRAALGMVTKNRAKVAAHVLGSCDRAEDDRVRLSDLKPLIWWNGYVGDKEIADPQYLTKVALSFSTQKVRCSVVIDASVKMMYFDMSDENLCFKGFDR